MRPPQDEIYRPHPLQAAGIRSRDQMRSKDHRQVDKPCRSRRLPNIPLAASVQEGIFPEEGAP